MILSPKDSYQILNESYISSQNLHCKLSRLFERGCHPILSSHLIPRQRVASCEKLYGLEDALFRKQHSAAGWRYTITPLSDYTKIVSEDSCGHQLK